MAQTAKQLDAREQRFVDEYLIDLDPKRAAIEAGYSASTADIKSYGWVSKSKSTKPHVFAAIAEEQADRSERTQITQDWVLQTVYDTVVYCQQPDTFDANAVLKGCDLAGKHLGMFTNKHEHFGRNGGPIDTSDMTDLQRSLFILEALQVAKENTAAAQE